MQLSEKPLLTGFWWCRLRDRTNATIKQIGYPNSNLCDVATDLDYITLVPCLEGQQDNSLYWSPWVKKIHRAKCFKLFVWGGAAASSLFYNRMELKKRYRPRKSHGLEVSTGRCMLSSFPRIWRGFVCVRLDISGQVGKIVGTPTSPIYRNHDLQQINGSLSVCANATHRSSDARLGCKVGADVSAIVIYKCFDLWETSNYDACQEFWG